MKTASLPSVSAWVRLAFVVTIFLSAFLLFLVQPLISKIILPWFGGSTGVWATCMVFFQAMLCLGYAYAHLMQRLPLSTQRWCHWSLLGLGLVCLPVMPGEAWKPIDGNHPSLRILTILLLKTGLPYLALSATGPLLQAWHARLFPESQTYRLYALSNVASLASLLLFPLWFERTFPSAVLSGIWSGLFVAFAASCGYVAFTVARGVAGEGKTSSAKPPTVSTLPLAATPAPTVGKYLLWLLMPAFASFLLVGGTSHLCQDIASTPFLWILPLCLYLLSFILCFDAPGWYVRRVYVVLGLIGVYGIIAMRELGESDILRQGWLANGSLPLLGPILEGFRWYTPTTPPPTTWVGWLRGQVLRADLHFDLLGQIAMHCLALFAIFMICHGELAKRKPSPQYLTAFFLMISIGGALGSGFVSLVAPLVFAAIWEWWFGLTASVVLLCALLFQFVPARTPTAAFRQSFVWFVLPVLFTLGATVFQSSRLPLVLADRIEPAAAAQLPAEDDEELFPETGTEFGEEGIANGLAEDDRVSATSAIVSLALCLILAGLGGFACLSSSSASPWVAWLVVNATALGLVGLYLRDTLTFAIPTIFEKPSVAVDLTNDDNVVWRGRNFYGALSIDEADDHRTLQHGRIVHGLQYLDGPQRSQPTTYYASNSGVSIALDYVDDREAVHLGAIGLGTGTLAAFVAPDWKEPTSSESRLKPDRYRLTVYEINPLVVELSEGDQPWFCYLNDAKARGAKVDIVLGDARLMMERQEPQAFDVLAVDAFSGDSIPTHLLTDEAMKIYDRHLLPDGILAVHISNRYLDLEPICKALALRHGYQARVVEDDSEANGYSSTWVLLTRNQEFLANLDDFVDNSRALTAKRSILWTDAFSSLYAALMNSNYDSAVETIVATSWFQRQVSESPETEIAHQPRWLRAEWLYCETIPDPANPARGGYTVRVFDGMVEIQPRGSRDAAWVAVE